VEGGYSVSVEEGLNLRRGRAVDPESQGPSDLHVISCIEDSRVEAPSLCNKNCDIMIHDILTSPEPSISGDACQKIQGKSGFVISEVLRTGYLDSLESRSAISRRESCVGHSRS
jgi:hypothetical protein